MPDSKIFLHLGDLPASFKPAGTIAADCEMTGLNPLRDKLCLLQLSNGDGTCHLVKFDGKTYHAPRLKKILADPKIQKIFHFARADLGFIKQYLKVDVKNVYCTRIASYLCRTYTMEHGLKAVAKELLHVDLSKEETASDWGMKTLSDKQITYAAQDVLYLHKIRALLDEKLKRAGRDKLAKACFDFLETRAALDLAGFGSLDLFAH